MGYPTISLATRFLTYAPISASPQMSKKSACTPIHPMETRDPVRLGDFLIHREKGSPTLHTVWYTVQGQKEG